MEVLIENNDVSKWISLPLPTEKLKYIISDYFTDDEYQLQKIRLFNSELQPCSGNLFLLNDNLKLFNTLPADIQTRIFEHSQNTGVSFEKALESFLWEDDYGY